MPRIFPVVKKVVTVAGGVFTFPSAQRAAVRLSTLLAARQEQRAGTTALQGPTTLTVAQRAAGTVTSSVSGLLDRLTLRPAALVVARVSGAVVPLLRAGTSGTSKGLAGTSKSTERGAGRISRIKTDLAHTSFVQPATATQDVGGSWTNIARIEGASDGLVATLAGGLSVRTGTIRGQMAAQPNRPAALVVSHVELRYRVRVTSIALLESLVLGWRVGAGGTQHTAQTITSDTTGLQTFVADLTPVLGGTGGEGLSWATMAAIRPFVTGTTVVNSDTVFEVDSVSIHIVASETLNF